MITYRAEVVTRDAWSQAASRQQARSALQRPNKPASYYQHYRRQAAGKKTPAQMAAAALEALRICDRTERQIQTYPAAKRREYATRIANLRRVNAGILRKLGYRYE